MSYRMKITLPDPVRAQLEAMAEQRGEPVSRVAAQIVCAEIADGKNPQRKHAAAPAPVRADDPNMDRRAPWIEPLLGDQEWRTHMWGSIVALYGRYPRELARLKDGWWEDNGHVEILCALVVWCDWIDQVADDPRYEFAFHAQLANYGQELRQVGAAVCSGPGAAA